MRKHTDPRCSVSYRLDARLVEALRSISERTGVTQTRIVEDALRDSLAKTLVIQGAYHRNKKNK